MRPSEALQANREVIRRIVEAHRARNPRVFGSTARGEDREDSDLDLLVDATEHTTLLDLGGSSMSFSRFSASGSTSEHWETCTPGCGMKS